MNWNDRILAYKVDYEKLVVYFPDIINNLIFYFLSNMKLVLSL